MNKLLAQEAHFRFGENWKDFLTVAGPEHHAEAERGLLKLLPEGVKGKTFLDIGCGSGLHLLAAQRLGARAMGVDIDPDSVEAAKSLGCAATVCSVFDLPATPFDVVYSWGVLHHTGAMWPAVEKAASLVKPGGTFVLALYRKTPMCGFWKAEKRLYRKLPKPLQSITKALYSLPLFLALSLRGKNPATYVKTYKSARGMSFWHDVHDWLGGYPYESATPEETEGRMKALGLQLVRSFPGGKSLGLLGTGCSEYVFRRV